MSDGKDVEYYHGVYGYIEDPTGNKLLVITRKDGPYAGKYDLPGGAQLPGENRDETLKRTIDEETGAQLVYGNEYLITRIGETEPAAPGVAQDAEAAGGVAASDEPRKLVHTCEIAHCVVDVPDEKFMYDGDADYRYVAKIAMNECNASPLVLIALEHFNAVDPDIAEKYQ
ncbi:NUDIX domain-containing protein [Bifidobacterium amazonense]|uniref:NUDIX domain-containing protein n=1 Tax=Bifidobacterium amazonense TaxID=2809027 RepID=A0ABS9VXH7_9BIFI|nr:NUDIX domain-containing protein [Bifidobacterium amazonense]MCH9276824.1 NUDIX domain-containing protein [Bifidobacterium amazonense]